MDGDGLGGRSDSDDDNDGSSVCTDVRVLPLYKSQYFEMLDVCPLDVMEWSDSDHQDGTGISGCALPVWICADVDQESPTMGLMAIVWTT